MSVSTRIVIRQQRARSGQDGEGTIALLAKVTAPHTGSCLLRSHLMEAVASHPGAMVWLGGFPGCGKTTFAAQLAEQSEVAPIWLRLDITDNDPATFFKHLAGAAAAAGIDALPALSVDRLAALEIFARQFLRALFVAGREHAIVVFDDAHLLDSSGPVAALLPVFVEETPPGSRVVVTSREPPPAPLARAIINRAVNVLPSDGFRLAPQEFRELAKMRGMQLTRTDLDDFHRRTAGWAGAVALLEAAGGPQSDLPLAMPLIGQYISSQVLVRISASQRVALSKLAWLPHINANLCRALTGDDATFELLRDMARRGHFVSTHGARAQTLRLHDLLAEHLREGAHEQLAEAELATALRMSADALEDAGAIDRAIDALLQCQCFDEAADVVERNAPAAFREARIRAVKAWTLAIPERHRNTRAWVLYWQAMCLLMEDPAIGREHMLSAYQAFKAGGDSHGRFLALSYMIGSYFMSYSSAHPLREWTDEIGGLHAQYEALDDVNIQATAALSVWYGLFLVEPDHPDLDLWESRLHHLVRQPVDPTIKLRIGMMLSKHYYYTGQFRKIWPLRALLLPETRNEAVSPYGALVWFLFSLPDCWSRGDFGEARLELEHALTLSAETGIHLLDNHILIHTATACLLDGALEEAQALLARVPLTGDSARHMEVWHLYLGKAWHACLLGDHAEAAENAAVCLRAGQDMGGVAPQCFALSALAYCALGNDMPDQAREHLEALQLILNSTDNALVSFHTGLIAASLALRAGDDERCTTRLREVFALGREQALFHFQWAIPRILAPLCQHALEHGIEQDYVIRLVRERRLDTEVAPVHLEAWPWQVKVFTLGTFRVLVNDEPLKATGKAQSRSLTLLKTIIALGAEQVSSARLCDALWPDAEGDAAQHALESALYRLRKLIGKATIQVHDSKVSLCSRRCWLDARAFEYLASSVSAQGTCERSAMTLYQGPFLADDPDLPCAIDARERYAAMADLLTDVSS